MKPYDDDQWSMTFPCLLEATEQKSAEQQHRFFWITAGQLFALALAATASVIPSDEIGRTGPIVALLAFAGAIAVQASGLPDRAERSWYDARAASESIKSASWQFAVGGESFRENDEHAKRRLHDLIVEVLGQLSHLDVPATGVGKAVATVEMEELRAADRKTRMAVYQRHRIADQLTWYSAKAIWNKRRAWRYRCVLIAIAVVAAVFGIVRISGALDADGLSVFATAASAILVWMQAKKYVALSEAYAVTSHEIELVAASFESVGTEEIWAQQVHDAEAAFSREHTMWKARRQGPTT
ncbi:DUF4231 domain-containing protein [Jongsikchunia kroppenstedtii]|uniref:DUF4231 domain-containing protein n=1 Tax=Jongsikchunia kroppenstedtii TaxID=1121721 RepID=UPI000369D68B|nr:DUF4231 domain-containing protein [Jongsikchunia kroppenstedtii]